VSPPRHHDPRYPPVSLDAAGLALDPRPPLPPPPLPPTGEWDGVRGLVLVCPEPVHHAREFAELYRWMAALQHRAPALPVELWLRCALEDLSPFAALPGVEISDGGAGSVHRLPHPRDAAGLEALRASLRRPGWVVLLLGETEEGWSDRVAALGGSPPWATHPFGCRADAFGEGPEDAAGREATAAFHAALCQASPRWVLSPGSDTRTFPLTLGTDRPRFLVHQSRFHLGDALWLTPLLRGLKGKFPHSHITVVGGPEVERALEHNPHVDTLLSYRPDQGAREEERIVNLLAARRFDAALLALVRRPKSLWLARAVAEMAIPQRINLEYFYTAEDGREPWEWFTAEGWIFWGTVTSPRLLLHLLAPFLSPEEGWRLEDRRLDYPQLPAAREAAAARLRERGIEGAFAIIAPGARSSHRWPAARFGALAAAIHGEFGLPVLVEGAPDEAALVARVVAAAASPGVIPAQDPLPVLTALLARAAFLISNDSAPIHLAETTATPTLYFAHHEKLPHSHPAPTAAGPAWALFDGKANQIREITVPQVLAAVRRRMESETLRDRL
jgi:ADP-heptose:LPS heptosyltransferase